MKRVTTLILGLILAVALNGQAIHGMFASSGGTQFSPLYQAVHDKMAEIGNAPGIDTANVWDAWLTRVTDTADCDLIYVMATSYSAGGENLLNWMSPGPGTYDLTAVGAGLTHVKNEGTEGDGASYYTTGFNLSTDATHYTLNSGSLTVFMTEDLNESTQGIAASGGGTGAWTTGQFSDITYARINQGSSSSVNPPGTVGDAVFMASRTASNAISLYQNGVSVLDDNTVSSSIPNDILEIMADNGATVSTNTFALAIVAEGLSVAQVEEIYSATKVVFDYLGTVTLPALPEPPVPILPVTPLDTETLRPAA